MQTTVFSRINLPSKPGIVVDIDWHPELCDVQFACCVSDGSVYLIQLNDTGFNVNILAHLPDTVGATCLSWSPKGKQIAIGHNDGHFSQYKYVTGLQEVKKFNPPQNLQQFNVVALEWVHSALFAVVYHQLNGDARLTLISAPPKTVPKWTDFGSVCMENPDLEVEHRISLTHFGNILLCASSFSSEIGILGCEADDISKSENWSQWMLDDNSRIELPMTADGEETQPKGLTILKASNKIFKLSEMESYGGKICPILAIISSSFIVLPYLVIHKAGKLCIPTPPKVVRKQQQQAIASTQPVASPSVPITKKDNTAVGEKPLTLNLDPRLQKAQQASISANANQSFNLSTLTTQQAKPQKVEAPIRNQALAATEAATSREATEKVSEADVARKTFNEAIANEIKDFLKEVSRIKHRLKNLKMLNVGDNSEKADLIKIIRQTEDTLEALQKAYKGLNPEITTLNNGLLESFALFEEGRSLVSRETDPRYKYLLQQRSLDPITTRKVEEIKKLNQYLAVQLRELDMNVEEEWKEWLEKKKISKDGTPRSTSNYELVYKTLALNQKAIAHLKKQILPYEEQKPKVPSPGKSRIKLQQDISRLSESLRESSLNDLTPEIKPHFRLRTLSEHKLGRLREFLESRNTVPVRRSVDIVQLHSSRFISAIEKVKEKNQKLKELQEKSVKQQSKSEIQSTIATLPTNVVNKAPEKSAPLMSQSPVVETFRNVAQFPLAKPSVQGEKSITATQSNMSFPSFSLDTGKSKTASAVTFSIPTTPPIFAAPVSKVVSTVADKVTISKPLTSFSIASGKTVVPASTVSFSLNTTSANISSSTFKFNLTPISSTAFSSNAPLTFNLSTTPHKSGSTTTFQNLGTENTSKPSTPSNKSNVGSVGSSVISSSGDQPVPKYEDISPPISPELSEDDSGEKSEKITSTTVEQKTPSKNVLEKVVSSLPETSQTPTKSSSQVESSSSSKQITSPPVMATTSTKTTPTTTVAVSSAVSTAQTTFSFGKALASASQIPSLQLFGTSTAQTVQSPFSNAKFSFGGSTESPKPSTIGSEVTDTESKPLESPPSFAQATATQPTTTSSTTNFQQQENQTSQSLDNLTFCSLGEKPNPENANKNVFSTPFSQTSQPSLFATPTSQQQTLAFGSPATPQQQQTAFGAKPAFGSSSFSDGSGVAQAGFGAFQQKPQQQSSFGGAPVFGSGAVPAFGGSPSFGGSPNFGGSPSFGGSAAFGGSPVFGNSPSFGGSSSFGNASPQNFGGGYVIWTFFIIFY